MRTFKFVIHYIYLHSNLEKEHAVNDNENTTQTKSSTDGKLVFALAAIFCLIILVASIMMGTRGTDNTCNINEKQVDRSIEVRNYKPAKRWREEEHGYRTDSSGKLQSYSQMAEHYESASFEWRYVGTEEWAQEIADPSGTGNDHPYRREVSYDIQVCDSRPNHAEHNGKIQSTHHHVEFYI